MQYGTDNEKVAREELAQMLGKRIRSSGFFIDPDIEFLGASPDGLIDAGISELELTGHEIMNSAPEYLYSITEAGVVEIKCPITGRDMTVEEALQKFALLRRVFDACNSNILNKRHKHYFQVQGQLHISRRQFCIFAMWSPLSMKVVVVMRDDHFWRNEIEPFLTRFYMYCMLPEIIDSRYKRNMEIREPNYIIEARKAKDAKKASKKQKNSKNGERNSEDVIINECRDIMDETCVNEDVVLSSTNCNKKYTRWVRQAVDIENLLPPSEEERQRFENMFDNTCLDQYSHVT